MGFLADLLIRFGGDNSDLKRTIAETKRDLSSYGADLRTLGTSLTAGITAPLVGVGAAALKVAGELEQNSVAFKTMLGSADAAQKHLDELKQFALQTPFQFNDLTLASKKLQALGFEAKTVIPTLRTIGDAASALGLGAEGIQRITLALGQMKAKGTIQAEEMRQLAEAGIPAWEILAKTLNTTVADAMKQVEKRAVDSATAVPALLAGINERFGGLMEEQSKTLLGRWSNLKDAITFTLQDIGKTLAPIAGNMMENVIQPMLNKVKDLAAAFAAMSPGMQQFIITAGMLAAAIGPITLGLGLMAQSVSSVTGLLGSIGALTNPIVLGFAAIATAVTIATIEFNNNTKSLQSLNKEFDEFLSKQTNPAFEMARQRTELGKALQAGTITLEQYNAQLKVLAEREKEALLSHDYEKSRRTLNQALDAGAIGLSKYNEQITILEGNEKKVAGLNISQSLKDLGINLQVASGETKKLADNTGAAGKAAKEAADSFGSIPFREKSLEAALLIGKMDEAAKKQREIIDWMARYRSGEFDLSKMPELPTLPGIGDDGKKTVEEIMSRTYEPWLTGIEKVTQKTKASTGNRFRYEQTLSEQIQDLHFRMWRNVESGLARSLVHWKGWKDASLGIIQDFAEGATTILFKKLFKPLEDKLASLLGVSVNAGSGVASAGGAGSAAGGAGGVAGAASGGIMGAIGAIGAAVGAVFSGLSYFQGRRMEQDIARIEVTTRGMMNILALNGPGTILDCSIRTFQTVVDIRSILSDIREKGVSASGPAARLQVNFYGPVTGNPDQIAQAIFDKAALAGAI